MKAQSGTIPTMPYLIARKGEVHFIDLSSIVEKQIEENTIYEYDEFIMEIYNDESYIQENVNALLQLAKQTEFNKLDNEAKLKRRRLLEETDNYALTDRTMSEEMSLYRQHLRDITSQTNYPYEIDWGVKPSTDGDNTIATMNDYEDTLERVGL